MSQNLGVIERFYSTFSKGDWEAANACFAPECLTVMPSGSMNQKEHEQLGRAFKAAIPDARMNIEHTIESGEWVAVRGRFGGKHTGDMVSPGGTIKPQGKTLDLPFCDCFRIKNGKIVEHVVYYDQMTMLVQLGAMPAPH
jgi:ketosteroid isomerase-like protein